MRRLLLSILASALVCTAQTAEPGDVEHHGPVSCRDLDIPGSAAQAGFAPFGFGTFSSRRLLSRYEHGPTTIDPSRRLAPCWRSQVCAFDYVLHPQRERCSYPGFRRTRIAITMAEDMKSYDATVERITDGYCRKGTAGHLWYPRAQCANAYRNAEKSSRS